MSNAAAETRPAPSAATSNQISWLALTLTPGLGPTRGKRLLEFFGSIEGVLNATLTELEAAGLPTQAAQSLGTGRSVELANDELAKAAAAGVQCVTLDDPAYPSRLRQIYDPPLVLYVRGNVAALSQPGIAVIGTRHPTPYGIGMAERLACDLATRSFVIFSGLARGVDTAAHRGAVSSKGKTVAVFGTGVDVVYPKENSRLADQILSLGGALISEFPLSTFAAPQNFPIRNRIISGISFGVLVVEAAEYSGTRITARCALEQSRDVFAVPGNVTNKNSWGPNTLIKQGAKLTATWEDVWEELPEDVKARLSHDFEQAAAAPETGSLFGESGSLSPQEKKVYALLRQDESVHIDEIVEKLEPEVSSSEISAALFELELAGRIKQLPGKNFVKSF